MFEIQWRTLIVLFIAGFLVAGGHIVLEETQPQVLTYEPAPTAEPDPKNELIAVEETSPSEELEKIEDAPQKAPEEAKPLELALEQVASAIAQPPTAIPPTSTDEINTKTRLALVNILCEAQSSTLKSTSGSGILIDSRGIVLTNAHIAQHVLLAEYTNLPIRCVIRSGSPATPLGIPRVLYIGKSWIQEHKDQIITHHASGTGEEDFALLYINEAPAGGTLPTSFSSIPFSVKQNSLITGDFAFLAGYPAEFVGSAATRQNLYASTAFGRFGEIFTFGENTSDIVSLGGTVLAQSGSSGGGALNKFGELVGLIVTTTEGATTDERDLRAITMSHVNRSIRNETGLSLSEYISREPKEVITAMEDTFTELTQALVDVIKAKTN